MGRKIGIRRGEDGLLLLSLITVTFLLFNISILLQRVLEEDLYADRYSYTIRIGTMFSGTGNNLEAEEKRRELINFLAKLQEGNIGISFPVYVNDRINQESAYILMKNNESLPDFDAVFKSDDTGVYIGESLLEETFWEDEKRYITLSGMQFPVTGILENHSSGGADRSICILWNHCREEQKQEMLQAITWDPTILLQSQEDLSGVYREVTEKLTELGMEGLVIDAAYEELENRWYRIYNSLFQGLTAVFCLITCWAASCYWVAGRNREIAIRRTFGYDLKQLAFFLGGELLKLEGIALVGALLLEVLYLFLTGELFRDAAWGGVFLWTFLMQNVLLLLDLCLMMNKVKKLSMTELLKEE